MEGKELLVPPGTARGLPIGPHRIEFLVTGDNSEDASFVVFDFRSKFDTGMHKHPRIEEFFYVISGDVIVKIGERSARVGAGGFAFVPRGAAHGFAVPGPEGARVLTVTTPPGHEKYFEEFATLASRDAGSIATLRAKHHIEDLGRSVL